MALPAHPGCAQGPGPCDRRTQSPVLAGLVPAGRGRRLSPASLAWASVSISKARKSGGVFPTLCISETSHPASGDAQKFLGFKGSGDDFGPPGKFRVFSLA